MQLIKNFYATLLRMAVFFGFTRRRRLKRSPCWGLWRSGLTWYIASDILIFCLWCLLPLPLPLPRPLLDWNIAPTWKGFGEWWEDEICFGRDFWACMDHRGVLEFCLFVRERWHIHTQKKIGLQCGTFTFIKVFPKRLHKRRVVGCVAVRKAGFNAAGAGSVAIKSSIALALWLNANPFRLLVGKAAA